MNEKIHKTGLAIIGSGLASVNVIKELRKAGDTRPVTVVTEEAGHFYSKPMLSNALSKSKTPDSLPVQAAEAFSTQYDINLRAWTRVTSLDLAQKSLRYELHNGSAEVLVWEQLVFAVGAEPVSLEQVGATVEAPVHTVNQLSDYAQFYQALTSLAQVRGVDRVRIGIVGSGLIGCEFANDLANQGYQVSVVDVADRPMARLLPPELSEILASALSTLGVQWHWSQSVSRISQMEERVNLETAEGADLEVDLVLSAIGLKPNVTLAQSAGLSCGPGIHVDQFLRTSHPDIYALGDCATVCGISMQYVLPLMSSARALAKSLAGNLTPVVYPAMPVVVKTPACPVVVAIPPGDPNKASWRVSGEGINLQAMLMGDDDRMLGFALTGEKVKEKGALAKTLPDWLPEPAGLQ